MSKKVLIPIKPPQDLLDQYAAAPAESQINFQMQLAQINISNALTAMAIKSGAMTPEGDFVYPETPETPQVEKEESKAEENAKQPE